MDFWRIQEINNLKKLIKSTKKSIQDYNLEYLKISKTRKVTIKDYSELIGKFGDKRYNKFLLERCYLRLKLLNDGCFDSREQYLSTAIL